MSKILPDTSPKSKEFLPSIGKKYHFSQKKKSYQHSFRYKGITQHRIHSQPQMPILINDYYTKYHRNNSKQIQALSVSINFRDVNEKQLQKYIKNKKQSKINKLNNKLVTQAHLKGPRKSSFYTPHNHSKQRKTKYRIQTEQNMTESMSCSLDISHYQTGKNLCDMVEKLFNNSTIQLQKQSQKLIVNEQISAQRINYLKQQLTKNQKRIKDKRQRRLKPWKQDTTKDTEYPQGQKYISPWNIRVNEQNTNDFMTNYTKY